MQELIVSKNILELFNEADLLIEHGHFKRAAFLLITATEGLVNLDRIINNKEISREHPEKLIIFEFIKSYSLKRISAVKNQVNRKELNIEYNDFKIMQLRNSFLYPDLEFTQIVLDVRNAIIEDIYAFRNICKSLLTSYNHGLLTYEIDKLNKLITNPELRSY